MRLLWISFALGCTGVSDDDTDEVACPIGSHPDGDACVSTLSGWEEGSPLASARDHHVSFVREAGDRAWLFVVGGSTPGGYAADTVQRAEIMSDGNLDAFEMMDEIPAVMLGPGVGVGEHAVVVAGGLNNNGNSIGTSLVGTLSDDGVLSWAEGPELNSDRYHVAIAVSGDFLYAIGGMHQSGNSQTVLDTVERASFDGETLGNFEAMAPLPEARTHHALVAHDGALYLIGGGSNAAASTEIWRSAVASDAELGEWEVVGELPEGRATASALVFNEQLYVIGGMSSLTGGEVDTVLRANLEADGSVGSFEELPELPQAKAHCHQAPLHNGVLYSAGGSIEHHNQDEVYIGRLE